MTRDYVQRLRDEGVAPEAALIAVKNRLLFSASTAFPGAPRFEATKLAADASTWAIEAYYEGGAARR
jgi:hypothetical protein